MEMPGVKEAPPTSKYQSASRHGRIGGARVLLAGVALWSVGTLVAPPAAHAGLLALCASRVIVRATPPKKTVTMSRVPLCVLCVERLLHVHLHLRDTGVAFRKCPPWCRWALLLTQARV